MAVFLFGSRAAGQPHGTMPKKLTGYQYAADLPEKLVIERNWLGPTKLTDDATLWMGTNLEGDWAMSIVPSDQGSWKESREVALFCNQRDAILFFTFWG